MEWNGRAWMRCRTSWLPSLSRATCKGEPRWWRQDAHSSESILEYECWPPRWMSSLRQLRNGLVLFSLARLIESSLMSTNLFYVRSQTQLEQHFLCSIIFCFVVLNDWHVDPECSRVQQDRRNCQVGETKRTVQEKRNKIQIALVDSMAIYDATRLLWKGRRSSA